MLRRALVIAVATATLCACSASTEPAEQAVPTFHAQLDAGAFADIYAQSADDLKAATPEKDFVQFLDAVHRKLGRTKASTKNGWRVDYRTSGGFVTLGYATTFDAGDAQEQFVYRVDGKTATLVGYHISSNALIVK